MGFTFIVNIFSIKTRLKSEKSIKYVKIASIIKKSII